MFSILGALFGPLVNGLSSWFQGQQQLQAAKLQTALAVEQNKARLAIDTLKCNTSWEMAELAQVDKWMRRISFLMFTAPFVVALFSPTGVKNYFEVAIQAIPHWYCVTYMAITGAIWGISSLKNPLSQLFAATASSNNTDDTDIPGA